MNENRALLQELEDLKSNQAHSQQALSDKFQDECRGWNHVIESMHKFNVQCSIGPNVTDSGKECSLTNAAGQLIILSH